MSTIWSNYAKHYDRLNDLIAYEELAKTLVDTSSEYIKDPRSILDLGCGTGNLTIKLQERFPNSKIESVDNSEEMLDITESKIKGKPNVTTKQFDISNKNDWDSLGKYDLIIINNVLYTQDRKDLVLKEISEHLSAGGRVVISDPVPKEDYKYMKIIGRQFVSLRKTTEIMLIAPSLLKIYRINREIDKKYERLGASEYKELFRETGLEVVMSMPSYAGQANLFVLKIRNA